MKTWPSIALCAACFSVLGCRTDPNTSLLERDLLRQEKTIDHLQWELEDCRQALRRCQQSQGSCPQVHSSPGDMPATADPSASGKWSTPKQNGDGPLPQNQPDRQLAGSAQEADGSSSRRPAGDRWLMRPANGDSRQVQRIVLNRALTGGYRASGQGADEGITLLVEPRDAHDRLVDAAASLSVVVLDRQVQGDAARLARWDFARPDIATLFRKTPQGQGVYIELPWPGAPPAHSELTVFVRYTTADGRKLQAELPIQVRTAAQGSEQWTAMPSVPAMAPASPAPADWPSSSAPVMLPSSPAPSGAGQSSGPQRSPGPDASPPPSPQASSSPTPDPIAERPAWSPYR